MGTPEIVFNSPIGTRICKIDRMKSNAYSRPDNRVYYSGFIENKSKPKILDKTGILCKICDYRRQNFQVFFLFIPSITSFSHRSSSFALA